MSVDLIGAKDLGIYNPENLHVCKVDTVEVKISTWEHWVEAVEVFVDKLFIANVLQESDSDSLLTPNMGFATDGKLVIWTKLRGHILSYAADSDEWRFTEDAKAAMH